MKTTGLLRFYRQTSSYKRRSKIRRRLFWWKCYGLDGVKMLEDAKRINNFYEAAFHGSAVE